MVPEEGCAKSRPPGDCSRDVGDSSCSTKAQLYSKGYSTQADFKIGLSMHALSGWHPSQFSPLPRSS